MDGSFAPGGSTRVDVGAIEREFGRLWKQAAGGAEGGEEAITRACLLNLLVVCGGDRSRELQADLAEVFGERPCRILLVEADPKGIADSVEAWISAHCLRPGRASGRQVCCEQVTLRCPPDAEAHIPALARALTASDLPVILYLTGRDGPRGRLAERLAPLGDKVVVDSRWLIAGELAALGARTGGAPLADLGWARLRPLRSMVADLFDSPLLRPLLGRISAIRTRGGPSSGSGAALLHGWIRTCLGSPALPGSHEETAPGTDEGLVTGLVLEAGRRERIRVEPSASPGLLEARAEMPGTCPLPQRRSLRPRSTAALLCDELDRMEADPLFARALAFAEAAR